MMVEDYTLQARLLDPVLQLRFDNATLDRLEETGYDP